MEEKRTDKKRVISKKEILFPHAKIRKTQDRFISDVIKCVEEKGKLIAHVPTGIGKTAAVLGPLLAHNMDKDLSIIFATPRHTQHRIAIDTIRMINEKHRKNICAVDFVGKRWMCPMVQEEAGISSSQFANYCKEVREKRECYFYSKYKSKKNKAENYLLLKELKNKGAIHCQDLVKQCKEKKVCAYEVACDLARDAKVIIVDYLHILNGSIRDNLFKKTNKTLAKSIVVFDEAHNLPKRCKGLLSDSISTRVVELAVKEAKKFGHLEVVDELESIGGVLYELGRGLGLNEQEMVVKKEEFVKKIKNYGGLMMQLDLIAEKVIEEKERSFLGWVAGFLRNWLGPEEGFVRIFERMVFKFGGKEKTGLRLNYLCLDPSVIMRPVIMDSHCLICMSGTLTPTFMYKDLLGFREVREVEYDSPFPKENVLNMIVSGVSTKFTLRSDEMYKKIGEKCASFINNVPGNSFVFFPSYDFRNRVYKSCRHLLDKTIFLEESGMNKAKKDDILNKFRNYKDVGACLLGVSAGSFSEGVDLPGDELKAVVVVGIPLARPNLETNEMIKYYDKKFGKGLDYGYIYPAIITAIQNAGRCIRSEEDRGVIVFMDERYSWQKYLKCFPKDMHIRMTNESEKLIKGFFEVKGV